MNGPAPRSGGRRRPAWLAVPGRWAALDRGQARALLAAFVVLLLAALVAGRAPGGDPIDASLDQAIVDGIRNGGDVYTVAGDSAHASGIGPTAGLIPLPTSFVIEGHLPALLVVVVAVLLAAMVILAWYARHGISLATGRARVAALLLMLVGMAVVVRPALVAIPEAWAGLLVALSLARRGPGGGIEPVALALAAAMLSAAALPYAGVMAVAAWRDRREAAGWLIVLLVGAAAVALHAHALAIVAPPDPGLEGAGGVGPLAAIAALGWATGLRALPLALMIPLVLLSTVGWASRPEPVAARVAALIVVQAGLIAVLGSPNAALIVAPLLPLGLLAIPDAARGLLAAALDRRRITVTRVVR